MGDKKIYIVAKIFDQQGCIAYRCKTLNEARCVPGTLEALRADGVQIVILDSPEIYSEYAPYTYIEDLKEFIDKVAQMNRVAPQQNRHVYHLPSARTQTGGAHDHFQPFILAGTRGCWRRRERSVPNRDIAMRRPGA